jgi:copper(I)-binding protein
MRLYLAIALAGLALAPCAQSADFTARDLTITHPWTRPAAQGGNAAGYLTIANAGPADVLLAVETPVARASLHRSSMQAGMSTMRDMASGLPAPARQTVVLAPGGDHIMLAGLTRPLTAGQKIPVTLVFQRAGRVKIELTVETPTPSASRSATPNRH